MNLFKWCSLLTVVGTACYSLAVYQKNMDFKMTSFYLQNQQDHIKIMEKLNAMDVKFEMYALKRGVEDCFVYVTRQRDIQTARALTNTIPIIKEELEYRNTIRKFLDVK